LGLLCSAICLRLPDESLKKALAGPLQLQAPGNGMQLDFPPQQLRKVVAKKKTSTKADSFTCDALEQALVDFHGRCGNAARACVPPCADAVRDGIQAGTVAAPNSLWGALWGALCTPYLVVVFTPQSNAWFVVLGSVTLSASDSFWMCLHPHWYPTLLA
jgi:hypothetical protein